MKITENRIKLTTFATYNYQYANIANMRKQLLSVASFALAITTLSSCLGEGTSYTYYNDAAVTAFTLGTLNRTLHTKKSDGVSDSTYTKTLDCSGYDFYIDHTSGEIWNADSLPTGVDASKAVCTITTKNSSSAAIKSLTSDSLSWYSSTDSLDFSSARQIRVYNSNGTAFRTYTVKVNVHNEEADSCVWTQLLSANSQIAAFTEMKALSDGSKIYLFGNDATGLKLITSPVNDGRVWSNVNIPTSFGTDVLKSMIMKGGKIYTVNEGNVLVSDNGADWTTVAETGLKQLVAASTANLYALSSDNKLMMSADEGATWTEESLDDDAKLLPTQNVAYSCRPLRTNAMADKVVIIGNRSTEEFPEDTTAVVWSKVDEYSEGARKNAWNYVEFAADNKHMAPRAHNWQVATYDNNIKAIAGNSINGSAKALTHIYHSGDDGITWLNDSVMSLPKDLSSSETSFAMVADGVNSVWVICGGTGQVWKARINRIAWKEEDKYIKE